MQRAGYALCRALEPGGHRLLSLDFGLGSRLVADAAQRSNRRSGCTAGLVTHPAASAASCTTSACPPSCRPQPRSPSAGVRVRPLKWDQALALSSRLDSQLIGVPGTACPRRSERRTSKRPILAPGGRRGPFRVARARGPRVCSRIFGPCPGRRRCRCSRASAGTRSSDGAVHVPCSRRARVDAAEGRAEGPGIPVPPAPGTGPRSSPGSKADGRALPDRSGATSLSHRGAWTAS